MSLRLDQCIIDDNALRQWLLISLPLVVAVKGGMKFYRHSPCNSIA